MRQRERPAFINAGSTEACGPGRFLPGATYQPPVPQKGASWPQNTQNQNPLAPLTVPATSFVTNLARPQIAAGNLQLGIMHCFALGVSTRLYVPHSVSCSLRSEDGGSTCRRLPRANHRSRCIPGSRAASCATSRGKKRVLGAVIGAYNQRRAVAPGRNPG
jgi:hypothetical protein